MTTRILVIMVGGGVGAVLRYLLTLSVQHLAGAWRWFPFGTGLVNVLGSLGMGLLLGWLTGGARLSEPVRLGLVVGVLGGFTTYSAFSAEVLGLHRDGRTVAALVYLCGTTLLCLAATAGGYLLMERWLRPA